MPRVWCSISGHGFGHAAQMAPVLNELAARAPGLEVLLRTQVPDEFFAGRLRAPWRRQSALQDVGCVQRGPLHIDVDATWEAYGRFHENWTQRVEAECEAIRAYHPDLVLSDVSYLAVEAASRAGIPALALCNLTWDTVLMELQPGRDPQLIDHIRRAYSRARLMIRFAPGVAMTAFSKLVEAGPVAELSGANRGLVRQALEADETVRLALVAFGGVPFTDIPFGAVDAGPNWRFIVDGPVPDGQDRFHSTARLGLPFGTLLASCDAVLSKPGYATTIEAVAYGTPLVYVRRYNFADEAPLVRYIRQFGRGVELAEDDLLAGRWNAALDAALDTARDSTPPPATGAADAAEVVVNALLPA